MQPTLLCWNLPEDCAGRVRYLCLRLGLRSVTVTASACRRPLQELTASPPAPDGEPLPFADTMLLMCGFSQAQFHGFLDGWKTQGLPPVPLKAVLTAHNRRWDSLRLHEELLGEAAALGGRKEQAGPGA